MDDCVRAVAFQQRLFDQIDMRAICGANSSISL